MTNDKTTRKPEVEVGDFPVGAVLPFAGPLNQAVVEAAGWLYCNGNTISRTAYADLFAVIGTAHGQGDGTSTFNLPDYRGTFLRGVNSTADPARDPGAEERTAAASGGNAGNSVGSEQGNTTGKPGTAITTNSAGNHNHSVPRIPKGSSSYAVAGSYQSIWTNDSTEIDQAGAHTHQVSDGGDSETRPPNVYVYYLIRFSS